MMVRDNPEKFSALHGKSYRWTKVTSKGLPEKTNLYYKQKAEIKSLSQQQSSFVREGGGNGISTELVSGGTSILEN